MTWKDIRETISRINKPLFNVIETLSPDDTFKLYRIRYPFGYEILIKGAFYIPYSKNNFVPITDRSISKTIRSELLYNLDSNPVCMSTKNNAELYLEIDNMFIPYLKLTPGKILGAWGVLDKLCDPKSSYHPEAVWNMSAGVRSLFMLPKIGDKTFHKRLQQEFNLKTKAPKELNEQWYLFKEIIAHSQQQDPWEFELLCFSKKWFQQNKDPAWQPLYYHLFKTSWQGSDFQRNQAFWNLIFSIIRKKSKLPPSSYINDMVKQIHAIACGSALGFAPSSCEQDAPIALLQDVYVNGAYRLKDYMPIIMTPAHFNTHQPVYFSLNNITALEFSEKATKRVSLIQDITNLHHALEVYIDGIKTAHLNLEGTALYEKFMHTRFDCFYDGQTNMSGIHQTQQLCEEDSNFKKIRIKTKNTQFPQRGNFIRGCVRISHKK